MNPKTASQVIEPGAYQWIDRTGERHVGYVLRDRHCRLSGSFVSEQGNLRAVSFQADSDNGIFFGPIQLPA